MKINKYFITSFLFLAIIFIFGSITLWINRGEIISALKNHDLINDINAIYSENVYGKKLWISIWSLVQKASDTTLIDDAEYKVLVKDGRGNLYFPAEYVDPTLYADKTIKLAKSFDKEKIKFMYVQTPNKLLKGYTDDIVWEYNDSNRSADEFIQKLKKAKVNTLDLRELVLKDKLNCEKMFYKTDHHWTTPTAFWAFKKIVSELNDKFDLKIDSDNYYTDINNYNIKTIEKCYLGSLGRRTGVTTSGLDDYTFISPKFSTSYSIYNGLNSKVNPIKEGDFNNAIVINNILNSNDVEANKHATYFEWDYGNLIIKNKGMKNGIKILMIKDSFSLPLAAFLSTSVEEIHMVDLRDKEHPDPLTYVKENDINLCMMIYNPGVFFDQMFDF